MRWSAGPAGTKSYAVISIDPDVVADLSLMNKPGVMIPVDAYVFRVYALDVRTLGLTGQFFAPAVFAAMNGHILAQGEARAPFV